MIRFINKMCVTKHIILMKQLFFVCVKRAAIEYNSVENLEWNLKEIKNRWLKSNLSSLLKD